MMRGLVSPRYAMAMSCMRVELTAATNSLHPEIDAGCTPAYVNLVGGHPIWHVDARHKLYSLTISRARSMAV